MADGLVSIRRHSIYNHSGDGKRSPSLKSPQGNEMQYTHKCDPASSNTIHIPDSKVHGANVGPIWGRQDPDGPHVGPMNLAIYDLSLEAIMCHKRLNCYMTYHHELNGAYRSYLLTLNGNVLFCVHMFHNMNKTRAILVAIFMMWFDIMIIWLPMQRVL